MTRPPIRPAVLASAASASLAGRHGRRRRRTPLRIIVFGAHPDDCDLDAGGTAALWAAKGHAVKFVALTNGDAGHQSEGGGALAKRRRAGSAGGADAASASPSTRCSTTTTASSSRRSRVRQQVIRRIRQWQADVVIAPRPNDYHPDHRYTGVVVQDAAYMVVVPNVTPDTPPLRKNPVFLYFLRPLPAAEPVPARRGGRDRRGDREEDRTRSTPTCRSSTSGCRGWTGRSRACRRSRPRGLPGCGSSAAVRRISRRRARGPAQVVRSEGRQREGRRGVRGVRVRPPPERGRPAAAVPVLRTRPGGPGGAA